MLSEKWNVNINTHASVSDLVCYYLLSLYLPADINTFCVMCEQWVNFNICVPASHSLPKLQRVHGCVWAALQDGPGIPEGADGDRPADPEKVSLAAQSCLMSAAEPILHLERVCSGVAAVLLTAPRLRRMCLIIVIIHFSCRSEKWH